MKKLNRKVEEEQKMKKLNRKGFTLIELLAVIVVLAIILVVTIPSVLSSMNSAKKNSLQNAADSVAEWFTKQYELDQLGVAGGGASTAFTTFAYAGTPAQFRLNNATNLENDVLIAAGITNPNDSLWTDENYDDIVSTISINTTTKKVCVTLLARDGGQFYVNENGYNNTAESSGC